MKTSHQILLAATTLLATTTALPAPAASQPPSYNPHSHILTVSELQTQQPLLALPSNSNVTLLYSTLGIGVQNYTCNGTNFVQTSPGDGASALLYDTTHFLQRHPAYIQNLTQVCNYASCEFPRLLHRLLGDHYFSDLLVPTFNLTLAEPTRVLSASKSGDVAAPSSSDIDWLFLTANPTNGITQGLAEVYRIDTFQGKAPSSCSGVGSTTSVPYSAQYWFYE